MELTREDRERIYLEEVERREVSRKLDAADRARATFAERPRSVSRAVTLLLVATGVGVIRLVVEGPAGRLPGIVRDYGANERFEWLVDPTFLAAGVFSSALGLFVICKIRDGRTWARLTMLALVVSETPAALGALSGWVTAGRASPLPGLGQFVLAIVAFVYLFRRDASPWFQRRGVA